MYVIFRGLVFDPDFQLTSNKHFLFSNGSCPSKDIYHEKHCYAIYYI